MAALAPAGKESRERHAEAVELICECMGRKMRDSEILPLLAEYKVEPRPVRGWFAEAAGRSGVEAKTQKLKDRVRGRVARDYGYIVKTAIESGDLALALKALDSECKFFGLNAAAQLDITHSTGDERAMRDRDTGDLQERLNTLRTNGGERAN